MERATTEPRTEKEVNDFLALCKRNFILHFITATGILRRSFPSKNKGQDKNKRQRYKEASTKIIGKLLDDVDDGSLTNARIRKRITELADEVPCSVGLAQKGINVVLKYYCIVKKIEPNLLKELDCPIDSKIISHYCKSACNKEHYRLLKLKWEDYEYLQNLIEKEERIRILGDLVYENSQ